MLFNSGENPFEKFRSARVDLNPGVAAVRAALSYARFENFELRTEAEYQIENLREKERVNNVPGNFNNATRHKSKF